MKNSQKGFIVSLVVIILAVVAIVGGTYAYHEKKVNDVLVASSTNKSVFDTDLGTDLWDKNSKALSYLVDLNNDGHLDLLLYPRGPLLCGSGGCPLFIYEQQKNGLTLISEVSTVQDVYLESTFTSGWRDIVIGYGGGGGLSGLVKLQFNGKIYSESYPRSEGPIISANDLQLVF